eukprot:m.255015 g.255015  ORF g.255015 m.255015 type:complete len:271 (-) comp19020_c0_seq1:102-914(-)
MGNSRIWLNIDCCGLFTAVLTYNLILLGLIGALQIVNFSSIASSFLFLLLMTSLALAATSHMRCMLTDPGAVPTLSREIELEDIPRGELRLRNGEYVSVCHKCHTYKPDRAHHCSICGRCIRRMDHHCPWVNNCVGENNQKYFILFTCYIFLSAIALLSILIQFFHSCSSLKECVFRAEDTARPLILLGLVMECLLFGLFTLIMTCDQVFNIMNETSTIDRLKGGQLETVTESRLEKLQNVFGSEFGWTWLIPMEGADLRRRRRQLEHVV